MIQIPGDLLEGGGQVVRTSIALATLAGVEVHVNRIRDNRPNPGLQAQHVTAITALTKLCNAETEGLTQGSRTLTFKPHNLNAAGKLQFHVGTAGSIPLILQALMPCLAFTPTPTQLEFTGGTDVKWSPSIDYIQHVTLPILQQVGYQANLAVDRRGHYPKGGGVVNFTVTPTRNLHAINLTRRDQLESIMGVSHCVKLPRHVAQRQADSAVRKLVKEGYDEPQLTIEAYPPERDRHIAPGSGITLLAKFKNGPILGADSLGERGKPAEKVGEECAEKLLEELKTGAAFDRHMGDILIPFIAVAEGHSEISVSQLTMHTLTNIQIAQKILNVTFQINGELGQSGTITVEGTNLKRRE